MAKDKRTYWEKLKDPRWQKLRLEVMNEAKWKCQWCWREDTTFNIHHGYYTRNREPWEYEKDTLWCLCEDCHEAIGSLKQDVHLEIARIAPQYWNALFQHIQVFRSDIANYMVAPEEPAEPTQARMIDIKGSGVEAEALWEFSELVNAIYKWGLDGDAPDTFVNYCEMTGEFIEIDDVIRCAIQNLQSLRDQLKSRPPEES